VADFGLSRAIDDLSGTIEGHVLGTPQYISPEQALGTANLDIRCDLYSLAATMFHMVTGKPPYEGDTFQTLILAHVHGAVPSARVANGKVPECLSGLLRRFMSKNPSDRAANMEAAGMLVADVEAELQSVGSRVGSA
jgi:serine/threonine protein kinase